MQITDITQKAATTYKPITVNKPETSEAKENSDKVDINAPNESSPLSSWQKDILLGAIEKLENNKHVDNSHPLSADSAQPIETFEEALIELHYIKTPFFKNFGSKAQANLSGEDVLGLFMEN